jgi:hypothetical protein
MSQFPPFHPEWLVTFWFQTPVLKWINPHWFLISLVLAVIALFLIKRKRFVDLPVQDQDEQQFQHLLTKKQIIEKKIYELESQKQEGILPEEEFQSKLIQYKKHLDKVNLNLSFYT